MRRLVPLVLLAAIGLARPALAEDLQPPRIVHTPVKRAWLGDTVTVSARMQDESEIFAPTLYFRHPGALSYSSIEMSARGDLYVASVEASADIEYWLEAYDEFGNGPTREGSPDKPLVIVVAERPAGVAGLVAEPAPALPADAPIAAPVEENAAPVVAESAPPAVETAPVVAAAPSSGSSVVYIDDLPEPAPVAEPAPPAEFDPNAPLDSLVLYDDDFMSLDPTLPATPKERPIYQEWWVIGGSAVVGAAVIGAVVWALAPEPVYRATLGATFKR